MARWNKTETPADETFGTPEGTYGAEIETPETPAVAETPETPKFDATTLIFEDADEALPPRTRTTTPNPYTGIVAASFYAVSNDPDNPAAGAKRTGAVPNADVKEVVGLLRRAANDAEHGLKIRETDQGDGTTVVRFRAETVKRSRAYTVADVRTWARSQGYSEAELLPKVGRHVSTAYRVAHGHKVAKNG